MVKLIELFNFKPVIYSSVHTSQRTWLDLRLLENLSNKHFKKRYRSVRIEERNLEQFDKNLKKCNVFIFMQQSSNSYKTHGRELKITVLFPTFPTFEKAAVTRRRSIHLIENDGAAPALLLGCLNVSSMPSTNIAHRGDKIQPFRWKLAPPCNFVLELFGPGKTSKVAFAGVARGDVQLRGCLLTGCECTLRFYRDIAVRGRSSRSSGLVAQFRIVTCDFQFLLFKWVLDS